MSFRRYLYFLFLILSGSIASYGQIIHPLTWDIKLETDGGHDGVIVFDARIERGWHLYDVELPEGGPVPTSVVWDTTMMSNVEIVGKLIPNRPAKKEVDLFFNLELGIWENSVSFKQKVRLKDPLNYNIEGAVIGQVCNDQTCQRNKKEFKFSKVTAKEEPQDTLPVAIIPNMASGSTTAGLVKTDYWNPIVMPDDQSPKKENDSTPLWFIFIGGFVGGLLALLTPCVWPMIPLTVSFFLKKHASKRKAVSLASIYGLSIIVIYLLLGLLITWAFGPGKLNEMATSAMFNVFFFVLLVVFAISFFGVFEITLPGKWTNTMDSKAGKTTGIVSIFFMAFTLALVSFSCTGPIIGTLLVEAVTMGNFVGPAFGMGGFALALAIPFTLFAIFPSWLKGLPKSGSWLSSVKVVLGFIELALSLKFLSVADLAYGWGILDREVFLSLWIVIFALLGCYLLKIIRFYGEPDKNRIGAFRLLLAVASLSFSVYLLPGLWGAPLKSVSAFTPPLSTQDFNLYEAGKFIKYDDFDAGMEAGSKLKKPVFIDFSGYGCVNCRKMEASVFENDKIKRLIEDNFVMITLMTDDKKDLPKMLTFDEDGETVKLRTYGDLWSYLQQYKFKASSQPYYAILDNEGNLISGPAYYDENIKRFESFLKKGINNYKHNE